MLLCGVISAVLGFVGIVFGMDWQEFRWSL
jgi:hypothetical protein